MPASLAKLREEQAEHGANSPWRQDSGWGENILGADGEQLGAVEWVTDAALIVASVNALEPLIAEVRRGRALREAVEKLLTRAYPVVGARSEGTTLVVKADDLRTALAAVDGGEQ